MIKLKPNISNKEMYCRRFKGFIAFTFSYNTRKVEKFCFEGGIFLNKYFLQRNSMKFQ